MLDTHFTEEDYNYMDRHPQVMGENLEHYANRIRGRRGDYHTFGSALGDIGNLAVELMGAKRGYNKRKAVKKGKKTSSNINIHIQTVMGRGSRGTSTAGRRLQQIQPAGLTFPNRSNALLQRTGFGFQGYGLDPQSQHNLAQVLSKSQEVNKKLEEQNKMVGETLEGKIDEQIKAYIFKKGELAKKSELYGIPEEMLVEAAAAGIEPREYYRLIIEGAPEEFSASEKFLAGYKPQKGIIEV